MPPRNEAMEQKPSRTKDDLGFAVVNRMPVSLEAGR